MMALRFVGHAAALVCLIALPPLARAQFLGKSAAVWAHELATGDEAKRRNAAFALGKLSAAALPWTTPLRAAALQDTSAKVREAAIFSLGEIAAASPTLRKDRGLRETLVKALGDADPLVRRSAAYAVGCLQADGLALRTPLERLLDDRSPDVRQNVAWALGQLGDDSTPALVKALGDADPLVLRDAAAAFSRLSPEARRGALIPLARLTGHDDIEVKKAAVAAIVSAVHPADAKSIAITASLVQALSDTNLEVRRGAALALGNIGGRTGSPALVVLIETLREGDLGFQTQAAMALGKIGPHAEKAVPELIARLKTSDQELRTRCAQALGGIGPASAPAVEPLAVIVADRNDHWESRVQAAMALAAIGKTERSLAVAPQLLAVVADPKDDGRVRERVMWALRNYDSELPMLPGVREAFVHVLREPPSADNAVVRYDCAILVSMVYGSKAPAEVFPVLLEFLKDETVTVYRKTSTQVIGSAQESTAGKALSTEIREGEGRDIAMAALRDLGVAAIRRQPAIVEQLRRLADSERTSSSFRQKCRDYLRSIGE